MPATRSPTASRTTAARKPLWAGPQVDGITFSLLSKFLVCRERFRLKVVEGLVEDEGFNASIEYGSLFHEAEEAHRRGKPWDLALKRYRTKLLAKYPDSEVEIHKWSAICMKQFPLYLKHWETHDDETNRKPLLAEAPFRVPYTLPSGRIVILRGKFDAITILPIEDAPMPRDSAAAKALKANKRHKPDKGGSTPNGRPQPRTKAPQPALGIFLQENKTKGQIDEEGILGTVAQNLQSMLYQIALRHVCTLAPIPNSKYDGYPLQLLGANVDPLYKSLLDGLPVSGTLYNVIRRPLADRFAIKQREGRLDKKTNRRVGAETANQFYERVAEQVREFSADPTKPQFFMRWKVLLDDADMERFKQRVFNPILEQLLDWWEWISVDPFDPWRPRTNKEMLPILGENVRFAVNDHTISDDVGSLLFQGGKAQPHYQTPWGIYNSMFGGFRGDYFQYLTADREYRLSRITNLFPELEP